VQSAFPSVTADALERILLKKRAEEESLGMSSSRSLLRNPYSQDPKLGCVLTPRRAVKENLSDQYL
jgi:hypothetical protein